MKQPGRRNSLHPQNAGRTDPSGESLANENCGAPFVRSMKRWRSRPVSRVLSWTVIPLGASSPIRSSNLPGDTAGRGIASLFGLAPGGVCRAGLLPGSRCALTAPFHPCLISEEPSAVSFCCTFRRLAPPRRYLAPCPVEPGLSSASFRMTRLSGRLRRRAFYGFASEYPKVCCANFGPAPRCQSPRLSPRPLTKGAFLQGLSGDFVTYSPP